MTALTISLIMISGVTVVPEEVTPGDGLVRVTVEVDSGDQVNWLISSPRNRDSEAVGNLLIFSAGSKPGVVQGDVTIINWDKQKYERILWEVTIGEPLPPDPPDPPNIEDGLWGLTSTSYMEALQLDAAAYPQVPGVANNYASVASQIDSGSVTTTIDAKNKLISLNFTTVPEAMRSHWVAWDAVITAILIEHDTELQAAISKVSEAYKAISSGLKLAEGK